MREKEAKHFGLSDVERKEHVSLNVVKANYGPSGTSWWFKKVPIPGWQAIKLEPVSLLPKGQMMILSQLSRKITDLKKPIRGALQNALYATSTLDSMGNLELQNQR